MGLWAFYFFAKLYLFFRGHLQFDAVYNLALLGYWVLPALYSQGKRKRELSAPLRKVHAIVGGVLAFLVFWHDSYFPPIGSLVDFLSDSATRPAPSYILGFVLGYWNGIEALILAVILGLSILASRRKLKLAPAVALFMLFPIISGYLKRAPSVGEIESDFYEKQADEKLTVRFTPPKSEAPPFDIVLLQVCSLSWDDLAAVGLEKHPFLSEFDYLFTRFNTVTTYSTPAALRLLRANCGQSHHDALYRDSPEECFLMESLRRIGYTTETVFNHSGKLTTKMAEETARLGKADAPMDLKGIPAEAINFDDTPVFNNFTTLNEWWKKRLTSGAGRAAVFYNTVSLHGGAHYVSDKTWWKRTRPEMYREAAMRTFGDLSHFFSLLKDSGRDVLVVLVPEHGAAIQGTSIQAQDLRDIPLPKIATVPMGVRFFSAGRSLRPTQQVHKPVSYRSISSLINEVLRNRVSRTVEPITDEVLNRIPEIPYFAENEHARTTISGSELYYRGKEATWKKLPPDLIPSDIR